MPQEWISCGEALKIARLCYGEGSDFFVSHPAHIAVFRAAGDGRLSLKAEAITANFDGSNYAVGKAMTNDHLPMMERDVDTILRLTTSKIYSTMNNKNNNAHEIINVEFWDIVISVFDMTCNLFDNFFEKWTVSGLMFERNEIEYQFCNDESKKKSLLKNNIRLGRRDIIPYSDQERMQWILTTKERNADKAHKLYKLEPRYDGTKQASWRAEWKKIYGRKRGRPSKNVK